MAVFSELIGKTLTSVKEVDAGKGDSLVFKTACGKTYRQLHHQECCECVYIESIVGDLTDLVGTPILVAEESSENSYNESEKLTGWTFYKLATVKGWVDIRWVGSSNGYYSVDVYFEEMK